MGAQPCATVWRAVSLDSLADLDGRAVLKFDFLWEK
jgi:hypothetical protein